MSADRALRPLAELTAAQRLELVRQVQHYFDDEFDISLGDLRAGFVIEFFENALGPACYNRALEDARAIVADRAQTIDEELFALKRELPGRDPPHGESRPPEVPG